MQTPSSYDIIYQKDFYEIMSNSNDYNDGYWFGKDSGYREGYEEGVRAERERIKRAVDGGGSSASEPSTLGLMVGGSIGLVLFGWCFVGLIQLLGWIGGNSGKWWFPWIWRIAFWVGVGFIVIMSVGGAIMAIMEEYEVKHPHEKPTNKPNSPLNRVDNSDLWKKKYPIGNAKNIEEAEIVNNRGK